MLKVKFRVKGDRKQRRQTRRVIVESASRVEAKPPISYQFPTCTEIDKWTFQKPLTHN